MKYILPPSKTKPPPPTCTPSPSDRCVDPPHIFYTRYTAIPLAYVTPEVSQGGTSFSHQSRLRKEQVAAFKKLFAAFGGGGAVLVSLLTADIRLMTAFSAAAAAPCCRICGGTITRNFCSNQKIVETFTVCVTATLSTPPTPYTTPKPPPPLPPSPHLCHIKSPEMSGVCAAPRLCLARLTAAE